MSYRSGSLRQIRIRVYAARMRGQISQTARRLALQKAHHHERRHGRALQGPDRVRVLAMHVQAPLAVTVTEHGFQIPGRERMLVVRKQTQLDHVQATSASVVRTFYRYVQEIHRWVDHVQQADLLRVARGVEGGHQVVPTHWRRYIVHRGDETGTRAYIRKHFDVQLRLELQSPVTSFLPRPLAVADTPVAILQVVRIEVNGLTTFDGKFGCVANAVAVKR